MKMIAGVSALVVGFFVSFGAEASALKLASLECVASNGVLIKTVRTTRAGVQLGTTWGAFQREFAAELETIGQTGHEQNVITLKDEEGTALYVIALPIEATSVKTQNTLGSLAIAGTLIPIAAVNCEVQLRN